MALKDEIEKWNTVQSSFTSPILGLCTSFSCFYSKSNDISEQHHPVLNAWCLGQPRRALFLEALGFGGPSGFCWWGILYSIIFSPSFPSCHFPLPTASFQIVKICLKTATRMVAECLRWRTLGCGSRERGPLANTTLQRFLSL